MPRRSALRALPAASAATLLALLLALPTPAGADLTSPATAWSNFGAWYPFTFNGLPMRDFEVSGGGCTDPTKGPANFSSEVDISSGGTPANYNVANCNPQVPPGACCGPEASGFWAYYPGTIPDTVLDDWYAVRMRVNGDPRASNTNCISNSHWNFLLDVDDFDGFKEIWVDLWGNQNKIRLLYEDNNSQFVTNDNNAPAPGTVVNQFAACAVGTNVSCGSGPTIVNCSFSHSRVCGVTSLASDTGSCTTTTDATGEWYVDIMVQIGSLRDNSGSCCPASGGVPLFSDPPPAIASWFLSTSDSSTDPVQKDFIGNCVTTAGPCGYSSPTPVTLSYFRAERLGGGVAFEWSTASETGNVGFDLLVEEKGDWRKVTPHPVESKSPFALERTDYRLELPGVDGERFVLEDVDLEGKRRRHGPFEIERSYGARKSVVGTDWAAVRSEHEANLAARERGAARRLAATVQGGKASAATPVTLSADLLVDEDGVYRVGHAQLLAAGIDLSGAASTSLALTLDGRPQAIRVLGPATFGPRSSVEFLGEAARGVYTRTHVYRLTVDPANARRMLAPPSIGAELATQPETRYLATRIIDEDLSWSFAAPDPLDPWYRDWVTAFAGTPVTREYSFDVDRVAEGSGPVRLLLELWGMTDWPSGPDHHFVVALNGTPVADRQFDGLVPQVLDLKVPPGLLVEGSNTVRLTLPVDAGVDFEVIAVDSFGVRYPRRLFADDGELAFSGDAAAYAIDGFSGDRVLAWQRVGETVRFLGRATVEPSADGYRASFRAGNAGTASDLFVAETAALRAPQVRASRRAPSLRTGAADYLVIAHPDFLAGIEPLVEARRAEGLSVKVADVEDVFGEFGHGQFGAQAIRDYVRFAANRLGTEMVLLVGGDTYDYLDRTGAGSISFVPTLYAPTGPIVRLAPVDSLYGDLDGDDVPDVSIGRFPVRTAAELAAIVGKTLAYPAAGNSGRAVFAADRNEIGSDFQAVSEQSLAQLPSGWQIDRAYVDTLGVDGARALLLGALDDGVAFAQYAGHSASTLWSFSRLFDRDDALALTNTGRPTVVSQLGCWNAFHVSPSASTLAEALLTAGDRGAAAVLGPSALSATNSNLWMARTLNHEIFANGRRLGPAIVAAQREIAATRPWMIDVVRGFTLLGDPALAPAP